VLRRIFGPKRDEIVGGWEKIRMIKSRKMRWAGHVAHMGSREIHIGVWWESRKERDH
jgi:hypothetical protein